MGYDLNMSYQALLFCQDEKTARTVTQVLNELDFQVDPCSETFAAVKKLTSQAFEAIVVDCQNEENASLLLKTARNSVSNQASLMVALVEGQAGVASAFRIGANLVLTKPIAVEQARGTLRVARGLLRKNAGTPSPVSGAAAATPVAAATAPTQPSVSFSAPSAPVPPLAAPAAARIPVPAASIPPRSLPPQSIPPAPPAPRVAPVPPSALRAVASSSNLESESELQPQPDAASAGLLEALEFKTFEPAPLGSFAPSAPEIVSVSELSTGAHEAVRAALASRPPMSSQEFSAGFGAAAAAAPAKERPEPVAPAMSAQVAELFEAPVFGQTMAAPAAAEEPAAHSSELDFTGSPATSRSKTPLIAVAAIVTLAAVLYFGWSQMHKPTAAATPTAGPLQPPPPDFGAADAANQPPPPAHAAAADPTPPDATQTPAEPINRFARQQRVAEDRVTTPIAVVTPHPAPSSSQTPIHVKSELQRAPQPGSTDTAEAPSIANLGAPAKPDALNTIAHSSTTALPAAPSMQRVSQGVSEGLLLKRVQPVYPQQALQMHTQGMVALQATVGKDGSVRNVKVISGPATLARAATDAVRQWKYRPYTLNGEPVEIQTEININFVPPR